MTHDDRFGMTMNRGYGLDLEPLASQVIMLLSERQTVNPVGARQVIVDHLVRSALSSTGFDPVQVMHELRGYRLTVDAVIDLYVPQAAVCLGELWNSSDIHFADVTVGSLRLQALLSEAVIDAANRTRTDVSDVMTALVVVPEGEQHFLGANVVAAQLRRLGCDTSVSFCETSKEVAARVRCDQPEMVLFSCARGAALASVARTVEKIRAHSNPAPVIAVGGPVKGDMDGIKKKAGADLMTNNAKDVVGFCAKRKKALGRG
jgi:methylmalonyl-CoA mutase cobalamin-binding subunit